MGAGGDGFGNFYKRLLQFGFVSLVIAWPLAIWKMFEILGWMWNHISISIGMQ